MESISSAGQAAPARRGRLNRQIKDSLRDLGTQLAQLNHSVGARLDLKPTDLGCLDLLSRQGPISPIERGRDPADRRGVVVQVARGRGAEVLRLYLVDSGMNTAMDEICAQYGDEELELLIGFLRRTADAGRAAAERLAGG